MFELARREPDGSYTTIRIYEDDHVGEAYLYAEDIERQKVTATFREQARMAGLEPKLNAIIKRSLMQHPLARAISGSRYDRSCKRMF